MDTTSHDFTFQSWTFGTIGSSSLYDVVIIDENNIIAVGEIMVADSSPNGYTTYGGLIWDGNSWKLKRLQYGNNIAVTPRGILVVNPNEIYLASGSIFKWDGISDTVTLVFSRFNLNNPNATINKLWGFTSESIYGVGNNGSIAHYNGTSWKKIESGTTLNINDIWGDYNEKTGEWEILAVGSRNLPLDKAIFRIGANSSTVISSSPILWELFALWFVPNRHYYVVGSGIYEKKFLLDSLWKNAPLDITRYGTSGIRGNGPNDVFVAGAFGEFLHFNGVNWKSYISELGLFSGSYGGIAVKNNLVITVGYEGAKAKILLGRRN